MAREFTVEEATDRYLKERKANVSDSTLYNHKSSLNVFQEFCDQEGVDDVSDIDSFLISDYRLERLEEVSKTTVYNNLVTLKNFCQWCEGHGLIDEEIAENMILPKAEAAKEETISVERIEALLNYLERYEYATLKHALFALLWDTGIRLGAARSLNVDNVYVEKNYIELEHTPGEDTPLKNGEKSQREVNLSGWAATIIEDYIEARRTQTTDDYGNKPLFSTSHGRAHNTTIRKKIVTMTRPCYYSGECPHDKEIDTCEHNSYDSASGCPSTVSPHPIRRSAISHWLDKGNSKELLSDRMDVSVDVLEEHYDARSEEQKRELRREMLEIE
jgi:site-specific recombinase XerD